MNGNTNGAWITLGIALAIELAGRWKGRAGSADKIGCPPATQDVILNTRNRDSAIRAPEIMYGPLNIDYPGDYWKKLAAHWRTTVEAAKKSLCGNCAAFDVSQRMEACMPGPISDADGRLGYCHMHHFKCHSARTCRTWVRGGPIRDNAVSLEWQRRAMRAGEGP